MVALNDDIVNFLYYDCCFFHCQKIQDHFVGVAWSLRLGCRGRGLPWLGLACICACYLTDKKKATARLLTLHNDALGTDVASYGRACAGTSTATSTCY